MTKNKSREKEKTNEKTLFHRKYKWVVVVLACFLVAIYVFIYVCFLNDGFLTAGKELEKRDWLSFLGAYLSFAGTLFISAIVILQSQFFEDRDKKRIETERKKTIQPILSVSIDSVNTQIAGTAEAFNIRKPESIPKHRNVTISIENAGQFPICNVIVFDKYLWQMLKPNDKKLVQVAYSDSPDAEKWEKHIVKLSDSAYERTESGIPKYFNINYDDIDGNEMFQTFVLKAFEETMYYSLERTEETGNRECTLP